MRMGWILLVVQLLMLPSAWGAKAKLTVNVVDDFGNPIVGAPIEIRTLLKGHAWDPSRGDEYRHVKGETDENGYVTLSISSKYGDVGYYLGDNGVSESVPVEYPGTVGPVKYDVRSYYRGGGDNIDFKEKKNGKWLPWNPTIVMILRPLVNPVKMYARSIRGLYIEPSEYGKVLGFDLIESDWVAPYGEGEVSDFVFQLEYEKTGEGSIYGHYYNATLNLTFPNDGDGIKHIVYPVRGFSNFRLPREAPKSGYESSWNRIEYNRREDRDEDDNPTDNYIFRVRTIMDERGNILSALYGKIEGPIRFGVGKNNTRLKFSYYLNPNPNDRNLEYGGNYFPMDRFDIGEIPARPN